MGEGWFELVRGIRRTEKLDLRLHLHFLGVLGACIGMAYGYIFQCGSNEDDDGNGND